MRFALILISLIFFICSSAYGELKELNNQEMDNIKAQAGVSIEFDNAQFYNEFKNIEFYDSDKTGHVSFKNVIIGDNMGWGYTINTNEPISIDIVEFSTGIFDIDPDYALEISAPDLDENKWISVGNIVFCDKDIGVLNMGPIQPKALKFWIAPPDDNTLGDTDSGLYFKLWTKEQIGEITYKYNTSSSFKIAGIHIANSFSGDPTTPSSWSSSGMFLIGEQGGSDSNFARVNITRTDLGNIFNHDYRVQMELDLPMSGSLRIENLQVGSNNFGPMAIDNIVVHKLSVTIRP